MMHIEHTARRALHSFAKSVIKIWSLFVLPKSSLASAPIHKPNRILLINGAHVGDVVISTSILSVLSSAYPEAEFGFLAGSWSSAVLQNHPKLAFTHFVDHWRLNRASTPFLGKVWRFWKMRRNALQEIRQVRYDMSVSLHCWFPDFIYLAWKAEIPNRLGFHHSWFAPYATMLADLPQSDFVPQGERMAEILSPLHIAALHLSKRRSFLPGSSQEAKREVCGLLGVDNLEEASYTVIHVGSGEVSRELPPEFWREAAVLLSRRTVLLFTGKGEREEQQIASIIQGLDRCISGCDRLTWEGFVAAVRGCKRLYGVESMAGHVAAAVGTKCSVVYTGTAGVARWRPEGPECLVFTQHVPCAPCGRPHGCATMTCLRGNTPLSVIQDYPGDEHVVNISTMRN